MMSLSFLLLTFRYSDLGVYYFKVRFAMVEYQS